MTQPIVCNDRTRPDFATIMKSDANSGKNSMQQIEEKRRLRHMKFPTLVGRADFDSFQKEIRQYPGYRRWNDEGDFRANAPYRDCDNIIDPVSGFVSAGGDIDRKTGHTKMKSLVQLTDTPHSSIPVQKHSSRSQTAPTESPRKSLQYEPGMSTLWNSQKISDERIRADLGGWTSAKDPRIKDVPKLRGSQMMPKPVTDESKDNRDQLALNYVYTSSTTRGYAEVPWDEFLAKKLRAPTSTLEEKPDMVSHRYANKRYDPAAQEWQATGRGWDWFQLRRSFYKQKPVTFCSPCPRTQHIPLYSGCIGADNVGEVDNDEEPFNPYTIKRVGIPRYVETGHRPDIPGYVGCTLYRGRWAPMNSDLSHGAPQATTAKIYRAVPISSNNSNHKKESQMSKMITTVPPNNPYNLPSQQEVPIPVQ